jgi:hypothetical protein
MRCRSGSFVRGGLAVAVLILAAVSATAQTTSATDGKWNFVAGLYGWFPAISGTVTVRNFPEVPIDVPFSDLFDHLKMNLTGHFESRRDKIGFGLDLFYVRLAAPVSGQIPELLDASVNLRQFIGEGFGFYRLAQGSGDYPWTLEALGGVRFWDINTRIESDVSDRGGKAIDWADGFGGLRFEVPFGSKLSLIGRGDVGAGGAKLDWSASGDLAYRLGKGWVTGAGYRSLNVDYDKAGREDRERTLFDVSFSGPRLWIVYTW